MMSGYRESRDTEVICRKVKAGSRFSSSDRDYVREKCQVINDTYAKFDIELAIVPFNGFLCFADNSIFYVQRRQRLRQVVE